jgi:hypothetical protein
MKNQDAQWDHEREILGFLVDGLHQTVKIFPDRVADIISEIKKILKKKQVQLRHHCWEATTHCAHHAVNQGPFPQRNKALKGKPPTIRLCQESEV